jgi:hypothetical protein
MQTASIRTNRLCEVASIRNAFPLRVLSLNGGPVANHGAGSTNASVCSEVVSEFASHGSGNTGG